MELARCMVYIHNNMYIFYILSNNRRVFNFLLEATGIFWCFTLCISISMSCRNQFWNAKTYISKMVSKSPADTSNAGRYTGNAKRAPKKGHQIQNDFTFGSLVWKIRSNNRAGIVSPADYRFFFVVFQFFWNGSLWWI